MGKRIWRLAILIFIISLAVLAQFSLISALPGIFRQLNLVLILLMFILFFLDFRIALISALVAGAWLDILSFNFFGFYLLIFFSTVLLANQVLKNWLTNRSFYSFLAMMVGSTIFYNFLAAIILFLTSAEATRFFLVQSGFWLTLLYQGAWSFLSAIVLFNLAVMTSKRIKPFFLEKKTFL